MLFSGCDRVSETLVLFDSAYSLSDLSGEFWKSPERVCQASARGAIAGAGPGR
jgi:hypothetical protein